MIKVTLKIKIEIKLINTSLLNKLYFWLSLIKITFIFVTIIGSNYTLFRYKIKRRWKRSDEIKDCKFN